MSYNFCLDTLPSDYNGWLIRTDFRIGMQISLAFDDQDLDPQEKVETALMLLYGRGIPDAKTAVEGLQWFMRCGTDPRDDLPKDEQPLIYYDFDAGRIWASFKATFGIDLNNAKIHWFEFCNLISCIGEDTSLRSAMEIRQRSTKDLKGTDRAKLIAAKKALKPPEKISEQQKEEEAAFKERMQKIGEMQHGTV